ncbi:hypothetical protein [Desulfosporosinus metallidurans]|uniref:Coat F domain-containing protein n=1 Tax=Desulfosporosinus metallidurans TaxID=1888891 RepID=A0A1Q8QQ77_9FIRM|nr:hypothetical protein [Desulfosporosinus metallidurans]OLN29499.1 hypothetical protein DSOL_3518 [Desulfosporosinus metallidurans]
MTNINYVMDMTKSFLDGEINCMSYFLDFPYEVEKRYRKMVREDRDYADLILECLVEEGTDKFNELSDAQFKRLIKKQYKYIKDVASEGFL